MNRYHDGWECCGQAFDSETHAKLLSFIAMTLGTSLEHLGRFRVDIAEAEIPQSHALISRGVINKCYIYACARARFELCLDGILRKLYTRRAPRKLYFRFSEPQKRKG